MDEFSALYISFAEITIWWKIAPMGQGGPRHGSVANSGVGLTSLSDLRFVLVEKFRTGWLSMISLKGCHFPKDAALYAVYFYLRYTVSYRDLEEIMAERGVQVDRATLNKWVVKYSPMIATRAQSKKRPTLSSWRMDETYILVRGKWMYLCRAVDKAGNTLDFMLSERRNRPAAARFFAKALASNGTPSKIVIDKSGANAAGIREVNKILNRFGCPAKIQTVRSKYLDNLIEQDHRFIKCRVRHTCGFKSFSSASATLDGIEVADMVRKRQFPSNTTSGFQLFAEMAG